MRLFYPIVLSLICVNAFASDDLLNDDLLLSDDFSIEPMPQSADKPGISWPSALKVTLESANTWEKPQTQTLQRLVGRVEYEQGFAPHWYLKADAKTTYYGSKDIQTTNKPSAFHKNKLQQLWVQYSRAACNHKLGKQSLIWGEVDGTFATDIVTPFDFTEQLLTDYNSIRLPQDLLVSNCFIDDFIWQGFYNFTPLTHRLLLDDLPVKLSRHNEAGSRLKWSWTGGDLTLMLARLNHNAPYFTGRLLVSGEFNFLGLSGSVAYRRLLLKWDIGYKNTLDRYHVNTLDVALGLEYTTTGNHLFTAGLWGSKNVKATDDPQLDQADSPLLTFGWSKSLFNDDLTLNLLANRSTYPHYSMFTLSANYLWNDYLSTLWAVSKVNIDETATAIVPFEAQDSLSMTLKIQF